MKKEYDYWQMMKKIGCFEPVNNEKKAKICVYEQGKAFLCTVDGNIFPIDSAWQNSFFVLINENYSVEISCEG